VQSGHPELLFIVLVQMTRGGVRVRSFVSTRVQNVPPSSIRRFFDIAATMDDVISLGIGEPDFVTPEPILQAGVDSLLGGQTRYTSNAGTIELRRALSAHLENRYHAHYAPDEELLITVGVSEALYLALVATVDPGDEVIVPEPCFVAYKPGVILAGGTPVVVPTRVEDGFQVTAEAIRAAITPKTKVLLIGYPSNPTGAVMTRERLTEIAEIVKKHDMLVISDEIYDQLVYGVEHVCVASLPGMRERTITLGGFSKNYAMTGWRIGYAAAPPDLLDARTRARHRHARRIRPAAEVDRRRVQPTGTDHLRAAWGLLRISFGGGQRHGRRGVR
jgi:aminotransferase